MQVGEPAAEAAAAERHAALPPGAGDRFSGYAVVGVPFESGDVLALRRYPASSDGPGYTSVWHRAPDGRWTFYADVAPTHGCARYFGPALDDVVVRPIRLEWTGDRRLNVAVDGGRLVAWSVCLASTPATRLVTALASRLPAGCWKAERAVSLAGRVAGRLLGIGRFRLIGHAPSGARFVAMPRAIWMVAASRARVDGRVLGPVAPLARQAALGDLWLPQRGLFAVVQTRMEGGAATRANEVTT